MTKWSAFDEACMARALRLARRGEGYAEPNPMVGCVLARGRRIIGQGWHRRYGGPHAEVMALASCDGRARGSTAYVTLEPCCHFGKTPPCADALIRAGVRRVVSATRDPNPQVDGGGFSRLRRAGVKVETGLMQAASDDLIAPFRKLTLRGLPWVIAKWAQSVDGTIATRTRDSKWISDEAARAHAHRMRGRMDAILVGIETVLADDPMLTCRVAAPRRVATRVVLDSQLRTPPTCSLVRTAREVPLLILASRSAPARRKNALLKAGCEVVIGRRGADGVAWPDMLEELGRRRMLNVMVEGGAAVLGSLLDGRHVDECCVYIAPRILGGRAAVRAVAGEGPTRVRDGLDLINPRMDRVGTGWVLSGRTMGGESA